MTNESNRYGDGTVFEGVRSKDSIIPTLQLATNLEGPHGMTTLLQAASELRRLHEVNQELVEALEKIRHWGESQHKSQSKGGHATFDMMMLREQIDTAEAVLAKAKGESNE